VELLEARCVLSPSLTVGPNINVGKYLDNQAEESISVSPTTGMEAVLAMTYKAGTSGPGLTLSVGVAGGGGGPVLMAGGKDDTPR
jgi:hypothetical protein